MIVGVHPAQLDFLAEVTRGKKIVWHPIQSWLTCFSPYFDAHGVHYTHDRVFPGMHEIIYPLSEGRSGKVVGVKLCELQGLLTETDLLTTLDAEDSLSPLEVFEYGIDWLTRKSEAYRAMSDNRQVSVEVKNDIARRFLSDYPLRIPRNTWERALPKQAS